MTPLNTIIEEEREKFDKSFVEMSPLRGRDMHNRPPLYDTNFRDVEEIKNFLTTAIQRAYEAGRADWLRIEIEKLEEEKLWEYDFQGKRSMVKKNWNDAITSIITRYKEELKELTGK